MTTNRKPPRAIAFAVAALLLAIATPACAEEKSELLAGVEAVCGRSGEVDEAKRKDCVTSLLASVLKDELLAGIEAMCELLAEGDEAKRKDCVTNQVVSALYVKTHFNQKIEPSWDRENREITARCEARLASDYLHGVLRCMVEGLRELNARLAAERGD